MCDKEKYLEEGKMHIIIKDLCAEISRLYLVFNTKEMDNDNLCFLERKHLLPLLVQLSILKASFCTL